MINIVVTSKPVDGLLYYSYEYCDLLNKAGYPAQVVIVRHRNFDDSAYIETIKNKYVYYNNVVFDYLTPNKDDVTLIFGRSMMTLSWQDFNDYNEKQQKTLRSMFGGKVISVYSENHPTQYPKALEFYNPTEIVDLCDKEVYPNGVGEHFEKHIKSVNKTLQEIKCNNKPLIIVFNKIDQYQYIPKETDDLSPIKKENLSLDYWKQTWMSGENRHTVFISCLKKINMNDFKSRLYEVITMIQKEKYPYNNFLY